MILTKGNCVKFVAKKDWVSVEGYEKLFNLLDPNTIYTIKSVKVLDWSSSYKLEEIPKCSFNSVWFKKA